MNQAERQADHFGRVDVAGLMTWDDLNHILGSHRLEPPRMLLSRDGETLMVGGYTTPVATRRHTVWHRLHPAELHARLKEGASLALGSVQRAGIGAGHTATQLTSHAQSAVTH
ncbi:hypothetical protein ACH4VM_39505 [Streptomyces sp. NPDC020792]|uniref:hypothetical protein n=1 Tax=Streptomyces sp. NPDC020792 TaxID=3365089 RepID=UPI0037AACC23